LLLLLLPLLLAERPKPLLVYCATRITTISKVARYQLAAQAPTQAPLTATAAAVSSGKAPVAPVAAHAAPWRLLLLYWLRLLPRHQHRRLVNAINILFVLFLL
jgi:hypothetical protein